MKTKLLSQVTLIIATLCAVPQVPAQTPELVVPLIGTVEFDGIPDPQLEFINAARLQMNYGPAAGSPSAPYALLAHDDNFLYIGSRIPQNNVPWGEASSEIRFYFDPTFSRLAPPDADHWYLSIKPYAATIDPQWFRGNASGGYTGVVLPPFQWDALVTRTGDDVSPTYSYEIRVSRDFLGSWDQMDGFAIEHREPSQTYPAPESASPSNPSTWASLAYISRPVALVGATYGAPVINSGPLSLGLSELPAAPQPRFTLREGTPLGGGSIGYRLADVIAAEFTFGDLSVSDGGIGMHEVVNTGANNLTEFYLEVAGNGEISALSYTFAAIDTSTATGFISMNGFINMNGFIGMEGVSVTEMPFSVTGTDILSGQAFSYTYADSTPFIRAVGTDGDGIVLNANNSGAGSLRQVISDAPIGATITFTNTLGGQTIVLTTGQILIDKNLDVDASDLPGGIMIDGNANGRIFKITPFNTVAIDSLTLTNGRAYWGGAIRVRTNATLTLNNSTLSGNFSTIGGGGIDNDGTLTLNNSTLSANYAADCGGGIVNHRGTLTLNNTTLSENFALGGGGGGILNHQGTVTLNNSAVSGNNAVDGGGGIHSDGTLTIINTTLSGNSAGGDYGGGGIYNNGTLALIDSTLSGNSALTGGGGGGGIYTIGFADLTLNNTTLSGNFARFGGGIVNFGDADLTLNNSTLSGNNAVDGGGGGIANIGGTLTLNNSTLSGNSAVLHGGGGIFTHSLFALTNSIVAGNTFPGGTPNISGAFEGDNNLTSGDPMLEPLGDYGGPTQTMPPRLGSPAINGGLTSATKSLTDQRGLARVFGSAVDIGAVEVEFQPIIVHNTNDSGAGSLRQAIIDVPRGETITFTNNLDGQTIVLTSGQLLINRHLNIDASGLTGGIMIDGNTNGRIFEITGNNTAVLDTLTLTNGLADFGGAIYVRHSARLTLNNTTLSGNSVQGSGYYGTGGGIYNYGTLTLNNTTLSGNTATIGGGGIWNDGGVLRLNNSTLSSNSADFGGGGIYDYLGTLTLNNSIVAGNTSSSGEPNISGSFTGSNNLTSGDPMLGPLGNYGGPTQTMPPLPGSPAINAGLTSATNSLTDQRGFARVVGSAVDIGAVESLWQPSLTVLNTNDSGAGSLREAIIDAPFGATITFTNTLDGQTIVLTSGQIRINRHLNIDASDLTGGIIIDGNANGRIFEITGNNTIVIDSLTLNNGFSDFGGAIYVRHSARLTLNNTTLSGNSVQGSGYYGTGGGIYNYGTLTLNNTTLSGNTATIGGGGIWNDGGVLRLNNSTLSSNSADFGGGGIYDYLGTLTLNNSIVAGNTSSSGEPNISGSFTGFNNLTSGDPMLGPLGNYGGPTQTMPPRAGSAAINAGLTSATNSLTDQRGLARVFGIAVDIGAVEVQFQPALTVLNNNDSGAGSLRQTIIDVSSGTIITFTNTLDGQTIVLTSGQLLINKHLDIDASDLTAGIIIDGNANGRIFEITGNNTVVIDTLTLSNGFDNWGGAIYVRNNATLTLNNSTLSGNSVGSGSYSWGGGIDNEGTLTLNNATLSGNSAYIGGGIYNDSGTLTINNSTLSDNSTDYGGGIYNDGTLTLNNATLSGNSAVIRGGGIYENGTLNATNSIVAGNTSSSGEPNIFGSITGSNNLISDDPMLAPLGDYGGPTQTMPPLPGSLAIDRGGTTTLISDQRGFARVGAPDIGAAEFQGYSDPLLMDGSNLGTIWSLDTDGDGNSFGVEFALGTDWNAADGTDPANLAIFQSGTRTGVTFGFNPDATNTTVWILKCSLALGSEPFVEIYRYDGATGVASNTIPLLITKGPTSITVVDLSDPQPTNAFYRFEAQLKADPTMSMVFIQPGMFTMGSPASEVDREIDEEPQTTVDLNRGFWMGKYEVTQGEYVNLTGLPNPSAFSGNPSRPVEQVSWNDSTNYCAMLTTRERLAGRIPSNYAYRLPTEAEWEYACRAGTTTRFSHGDDPGYARLTDYAWYGGNNGGSGEPDYGTKAVGQKLPNPWGLYDMHGNVSEWCLDWDGVYPGGAVTDPMGSPTGSFRVSRGGYWVSFGGSCRSANRSGFVPSARGHGIGFRVVLAPVPASAP